MAVVVDIDVLLAQRKMSVGDFARTVGITPANVAVLKNGRAGMTLLETGNSRHSTGGAAMPAGSRNCIAGGRQSQGKIAGDFQDCEGFWPMIRPAAATPHHEASSNTE